MQNITYLDPNQITIHPRLARQHGEWADNDPRFIALCADVAAKGIIEPFKVTPDGLLADGRHRRRCAIKAKLTQVPCIIVPEADVRGIIQSSLFQRRHYNKMQRAYLAQVEMEETFDAAEKRMLRGLPEEPSTIFGEGNKTKTIAEWSADLDISVSYLRSARKIHLKFLEHPELIAEWEPKLMSPEGSMDLGFVINGMAGQASTKDKEKRLLDTPRQLGLFQAVFADLDTRFTYWNSFDDRQKRAAVAPLHETVEKMPDDLLAEFDRTIKAEIRHRKSEATA